jgi:hypothetical protein
MNNDIKSSLYKMGLNGQLVNYIQDYIYPSSQIWKNVFQETLNIFNEPRDTVKLYEIGNIPIYIEYEWAYRLPGLISHLTGKIEWWLD